jgi:hypothetical protein
MTMKTAGKRLPFASCSMVLSLSHLGCDPQPTPHETTAEIDTVMPSAEETVVDVMTAEIEIVIETMIGTVIGTGGQIEDARDRVLVPGPGRDLHPLTAVADSNSISRHGADSMNTSKAKAKSMTVTMDMTGIGTGMLADSLMTMKTIIMVAAETIVPTARTVHTRSGAHATQDLAPARVPGPGPGPDPRLRMIDIAAGTEIEMLAEIIVGTDMATEIEVGEIEETGGNGSGKGNGCHGESGKWSVTSSGSWRRRNMLDSLVSYASTLSVAVSV